jgi:hypothetical protein
MFKNNNIVPSESGILLAGKPDARRIQLKR